MDTEGLPSESGARQRFELDPAVITKIENLVRGGDKGAVVERLCALHPADIASLLSHLPLPEAKQALHWLPNDCAGEVVAELDDHFRAQLLHDDDPERISALLDAIESDDAADVLADLSAETAQEVLPKLEDAKEVRQLLSYDEETAGGIMAAEFFAVVRTWTVAQAVEAFRRDAQRIPDVHTVFVIDDSGVLEGTVSLRALLLSDPDTLIGDLMGTDVVSVHTDEDQEEAARIMDRYDLLALPVVDTDGRLVGRITIDDAMDVLREEAEEDIQRMGGLSGDEEPTDSIRQMVKGRLPWLLGGLVGAGLAALVVGSFEQALQQAVILAGFIPIVMAMAGNVGIQSSAVAVQGLASGDVIGGDVLRRLGKEMTVALINGLATAAAIAIFVLLLSLVVTIADPGRLALTAGLSLLTVILMAAVIGATVPLLLHRFGIDPALATGPFITTSNDILGVLIFFLLASWLYLA